MGPTQEQSKLSNSLGTAKHACLATDPSVFCFPYLSPSRKLASSLVLTPTLTEGDGKLITPSALINPAAPKRPDSRVPPQGTTLLSLKGPSQCQYPGQWCARLHSNVHSRASAT